MARIHTHYDNLKVARNAPPEVIRAAYKTLSQKYHPDRNPHSGDAVRIIKIINSAYEVLSDPLKRREHDEWIAREEAQTDTASSPPPIFERNASSNAEPTYHAYARQRRSRAFFLLPPEVMQQARLILGRFSKYIFRKI